MSSPLDQEVGGATKKSKFQVAKQDFILALGPAGSHKDVFTTLKENGSPPPTPRSRRIKKKKTLMFEGAEDEKGSQEREEKP